MTVDSGLGLSTGVCEGIPVIVVSGEVDLATSPRLRDALLPLANERCRMVVIDLTEVSFLDSTGLSAIVAFHNRFKDHNGELRVVASNPMIKRIFAITALDEVLAVFDSVDRAVSRESTDPAC